MQSPSPRRTLLSAVNWVLLAGAVWFVVAVTLTSLP